MHVHIFAWVHEFKDGTHILIRIPSVRSIELLSEGKTLISFVGGKDSLEVRESPEEILDSLTHPPWRSLARRPGRH